MHLNILSKLILNYKFLNISNNIYINFNIYCTEHAIHNINNNNIALRCFRKILINICFNIEIMVKMDILAGYEFIKVDKAGAAKNVAVITLNRPKALNALCNGLMTEVGDVIKQLEKDQSVGAIVITGNEKAFAAGADIKEMQNNTFAGNITKDFLSHWTQVAECKKPVIAAVNGYAVSSLIQEIQ